VRLNIFCLMKDIQVMPELLKLICWTWSCVPKDPISLFISY
jgi:hypothetical protein